MDYPDMRIQSEADRLFKENDPGCIPHYIALKNDSAKSKLALIYLEGKCGQTVNIEKALYYSQGNSQYLARAVEAQIYLFIKGCSDTVGYAYYQMLMRIHEDKPDHPMVNQVLSTMYLQGKIIRMDFSKAVEINPRLLKQTVFNKAMSMVPPDILPTLLTHIESYENRTWSTLVKGFNKSSWCRNTDHQSQKDEVIDENSSYSKRIAYHFKNKEYNKASQLSVKWFSEERNEESAYHALRYGLKILNDSDYSLACDILTTSIDKNRNLKCILESARAREDWGRVETCLASEYSAPDMYDYDRGCLEDFKGNIDSACAYYLKSVYFNPKTERYTSDSYEAIARTFTLKPELVLENRKYADVLLSKRKARYTFIVADALYRAGSETDRNEAIKLLTQISNSYYLAALKMYEITGDQIYSEFADKLKPIGDRTSDYHFNYRDSTEIIEANYQSLPPLFRIRALDELAKRYLYGKYNVKSDYEKTKEYLLQEIDLCEENHIVSKFAKAKLGLMMYDGKIECLDEKQMFDYIYPLKDNSGYASAVASCLIEGIGTEKNIKEAISILASSDSPYVLRRLVKIYDDGIIVERDENKIYNVLKEILNSSEPTDYYINLLRSLSPESVTQSEEISYSCYQRSKISALMKAAKESNDRDAIRYYDFARKCGSKSAAINEARILLKTFRLERLAYSILKTSGVDPQDELFLRIKSYHQVLIDVDEELNKFFMSDVPGTA